MEIARAAVIEQEREPERYLAKLTARTECRESGPVWLVSAFGPSNTGGDSLLILIDGNTGEQLGTPRPRCDEAQLRLDRDQVMEIALVVVAERKIDTTEYFEFFVSTGCAPDEPAYWTVSARHRSGNPGRAMSVWCSS